MLASYAGALPSSVAQLHAADYRRPDDVDGPVLVVGRGQSGVQIAEELLEGARRVYLSTSHVGRLPRRHRDRDGIEWMRDEYAALTGERGAAAGAPDAADEPGEEHYALTGPRAIDLARGPVSTVIWATGFDASTAWLPAGALDDSGRPALPGLHVIGAPWLTHRSPASLYGKSPDVDRLADLFVAADVSAAA